MDWEWWQSRGGDGGTRLEQRLRGRHWYTFLFFHGTLAAPARAVAGGDGAAAGGRRPPRCPVARHVDGRPARGGGERVDQSGAPMRMVDSCDGSVVACAPRGGRGEGGELTEGAADVHAAAAPRAAGHRAAGWARSARRPSLRPRGTGATADKAGVPAPAPRASPSASSPSVGPLVAATAAAGAGARAGPTMAKPPPMARASREARTGAIRTLPVCNHQECRKSWGGTRDGGWW